jgi:3',5'-cyclic AMP phosphodiesterase CpdA
MAKFTLAHLSDPHLAPLPEPSRAELSGKRALGFFNWNRRRHLIHRSEVLARIVRDVTTRVPDHIAVTGDLVNISLAGEYPPAKHFLELLGLPTDVTLVPGNHDVYVREAQRYPHTHWGPYMRGDDATGRGAAEPTFPFLRRRGPLALIGLSSAVPTAPFMATGRLGAAQLRDLAAMLERAEREERFRVVLIHHPPASPTSRHFKRLVDGRKLRATLAECGAELVLHGHDHAHSLEWLEGRDSAIPIIGVPSASAAPSDAHDSAAYNLYAVEGTPGAWQVEMISRAVAPDGLNVVERKREMLMGG